MTDPTLPPKPDQPGNWQPPATGYPQQGHPAQGHPGYGPPAGYGQPPGYGPPPGYGYPTPAGPPQDKPSANWGWAIAALILFWPLAIPSFIFASRVDTAWNTGRAAEAFDASRQAKRYGLIGVVIGAVLSALAIILWIAVVALFATAVHNLPQIVPTDFPTFPSSLPS